MLLKSWNVNVSGKDAAGLGRVRQLCRTVKELIVRLNDLTVQSR